MREIIDNGSNKKILVCLPDVFDELDRYVEDAQQFYYKFFVKNYIF
jgi:hypothetical protein